MYFFPILDLYHTFFLYAGHVTTLDAPYSTGYFMVWACLWDLDVPLREIQLLDVPESS